MTLPAVDLTEQLDRVESSLPPVPAKTMALGRASARRATEVVSSVASDVNRRVDRVVTAVRTGTERTFSEVRDAGELTTGSAASAVRQTTGQARSAAERTRAAAESALRETFGQARAGAERTWAVAGAAATRARTTARDEASRAGDVAAAETGHLLDDATAAVDPDTPARGTPYEQWTKAQLYDRAQELDIQGRSSMSKQELITALRAA